jgi:hypothetical protein
MLPVPIGIYISSSVDSFSKDSLLGYTSESDPKSFNFGFFDIEFHIKENSSLFFYSSQTFSTRYNIGDLLRTKRLKGKTSTNI